MNPGEKLGRYEIKYRLAQGGMAEVWLAVQRGVSGFQKEICLKTIIPSLAVQQDFTRMFINEALLAARLNHPNVVQIFDLGQMDGRYYIAMEYVPGRSLRQISKHCRKHKKLIPPWFVLRSIAAVCDGLQYAHDYTDEDDQTLGLVHRDVTPDNVMVSYRGAVKILDFGVAKATRAVASTKGKTVKGKWAYIPPEQLEGKPADKRTDIYAVGITLYELLTGERPYRAQGEYELLRKIMEGKAKRPKELASWIPDDLEKIVMKAMSWDWNDRYHEAMELGNDLRDFLRQVDDHHTDKDLGVFVTELFSKNEDTQVKARRLLGTTSAGNKLLSEARTHPHADDSLTPSNGTPSSQSVSPPSGVSSVSGVSSGYLSVPPKSEGDFEKSLDDLLEEPEEGSEHAPATTVYQRKDASTFNVTGLEAWFSEPEPDVAAAESAPDELLSEVDVVMLDPGSNSDEDAAKNKAAEEDKQSKWGWMKRFFGNEGKEEGEEQAEPASKAPSPPPPPSAADDGKDAKAAQPSSPALPKPSSGGLPKPSSAGLAKPSSGGLPKPSSAGLPKPSSAGLPKPSSAGSAKAAAVGKEPSTSTSSSAAKAEGATAPDAAPEGSGSKGDGGDAKKAPAKATGLPKPGESAPAGKSAAASEAKDKERAPADGAGARAKDGSEAKAKKKGLEWDELTTTARGGVLSDREREDRLAALWESPKRTDEEPAPQPSADETPRKSKESEAPKSKVTDVSSLFDSPRRPSASDAPEQAQQEPKQESAADENDTDNLSIFDLPRRERERATGLFGDEDAKKKASADGPAHPFGTKRGPAQEDESTSGGKEAPPEVKAARHFDKGLAHMEKKEHDAALEQWQQAVELAPDNRLYQSNLRRLKKLLEEKL